MTDTLLRVGAAKQLESPTAATPTCHPRAARRVPFAESHPRRIGAPPRSTAACARRQPTPWLASSTTGLKRDEGLALSPSARWLLRARTRFGWQRSTPVPTASQAV